ncbi:protein BNIP5 [Trichosurus vulpecula]|uniref:protein BNIP5 n=1 Tax=Trichosurus vulpecula TaxID=9337 RepID=UPI00186AC3A8|nr:protein BNIP5 [Trichosurus vulpecula]
MEKHRASWKAELWMRRKVHSPDRVQGSKKTPGTGDSWDPRSLRRASSERVQPLDRQENLLDSDGSAVPKLEKTNGATREQGGQRSNHKDKAHKKAPHGLLKTLANILTRTGSEKQKERGEKKSKEKCNSPQDPKHLEAYVDPPEPTFKKKSKEKGDKKSKEKCISPQSPEPPEALAEPPEPTSKKKDGRSSLKKAFSFKKYGNEEAKKSSGLDSRSPEERRPTKPTSLALRMCYRPASLTTPDSDEEEVHERWPTEVRTLDSTGLSNQVGQPPPKEEPRLRRDSESKDIVIQKIVALLKEEGDRFNEKIKEDPNFKAAWDNLSLNSIDKLVAFLGDKEENQKEPDGNQVERRYHSTTKFTGNTNHAVHRLMGRRDLNVMHTFGHMPYDNKQLHTRIHQEPASLSSHVCLPSLGSEICCA